MPYVLLASVVLLLLIVRSGFDEDIYRLLKVTIFKSKTIRQVKKLTVVFFSFVYAICILFISFNFMSDSDTSAVDKIAVEESVKAPEPPAKKPKDVVSTKDMVQYGNIMISIDKFDNTVSKKRFEGLSVKELKKYKGELKSTTNDFVNAVTSDFEDLNNITDSERSALNQGLMKLHGTVSAKVSVIDNMILLIKEKESAEKIELNYYAFNNRSECVRVSAKQNELASTLLSCEYSYPMAFIFDVNNRSKEDSYRGHARLSDCGDKYCNSVTSKRIKKGFNSPRLNHTELLATFGSDVVVLKSSLKELVELKEGYRVEYSGNQSNISIEKSSSNKETVKAVKSGEHVSKSSAKGVFETKHYEMKDDGRWRTIQKKGKKHSKNNMFVFREFSYCTDNKSKLSANIVHKVDCKKDFSLKKLRINGLPYEVSGIAHVFKKGSFETLGVYPIYKSESGDYVYPNGDSVPVSGLYIGFLKKDFEPQFVN